LARRVPRRRGIVRTDPDIALATGVAADGRAVSRQLNLETAGEVEWIFSIADGDLFILVPGSGRSAVGTV
jgi:hypothetical protein